MAMRTNHKATQCHTSLAGKLLRLPLQWEPAVPREPRNYLGPTLMITDCIPHLLPLGQLYSCSQSLLCLSLKKLQLE